MTEENQKRHNVTIKLSDADYSLIRQMYAESGYKTLSAFLRDCLARGAGIEIQQLTWGKSREELMSYWEGVDRKQWSKDYWQKRFEAWQAEYERDKRRSRS